MPARPGRRPVATRRRSARTTAPSSVCTATDSPAASTRVALRPVRTSMPSARSTPVTTALASGSSAASTRSSASISVTRVAKRANACAISSPIAPPPSTTSDAGAVSAFAASRFVQYRTSARPGIGGIAGDVPVAITIPRRATKSVSPTRTRPSPSSTPRPRTTRTPCFSRRSTATRSFQSSAASFRMRRATGAKSGVTTARPAMPSTRRASASRSAARIIILLGTQP